MIKNRTTLRTIVGMWANTAGRSPVCALVMIVVACSFIIQARAQSAANAPNDLLGRWVEDPNYCPFADGEMVTTERAATSIVITSRSYTAYESSCRITSTLRSGEKYVVAMRCSGEGERNQPFTQTFTMLDGGKFRLAAPEDVWTKCPAKVQITSGTKSDGPKILMGAHMGNGTVISISGQNTADAKAVFVRRSDDLDDDCERNADQSDPRGKARCISQAEKKEAGKSYMVMADCGKKTVSSLFAGQGGTFQLAKAKRDGTGDLLYIDTDWRDTSTGRLTGNCSACGTPHLESAISLLCPKLVAPLCAHVPQGGGSLCGPHE